MVCRLHYSVSQYWIKQSSWEDSCASFTFTLGVLEHIQDELICAHFFNIRNCNGEDELIESKYSFPFKSRIDRPAFDTDIYECMWQTHLLELYEGCIFQKDSLCIPSGNVQTLKIDAFYDAEYGTFWNTQGNTSFSKILKIWDVVEKNFMRL